MRIGNGIGAVGLLLAPLLALAIAGCGDDRTPGAPVGADADAAADEAEETARLIAAQTSAAHESDAQFAFADRFLRALETDAEGALAALSSAVAEDVGVDGLRAYGARLRERFGAYRGLDTSSVVTTGSSSPDGWATTTIELRALYGDGRVRLSLSTVAVDAAAPLVAAVTVGGLSPPEKPLEGLPDTDHAGCVSIVFERLAASDAEGLHGLLDRDLRRRAPAVDIRTWLDALSAALGAHEGGAGTITSASGQSSDGVTSEWAETRRVEYERGALDVRVEVRSAGERYAVSSLAVTGGALPAPGSGEFVAHLTATALVEERLDDVFARLQPAGDADLRRQRIIGVLAQLRERAGTLDPATLRKTGGSSGSSDGRPLHASSRFCVTGSRGSASFEVQLLPLARGPWVVQGIDVKKPDHD